MHMSALNMIQMHSTAFLQKNSEFPILLFHSNGVCVQSKSKFRMQFRLNIQAIVTPKTNTMNTVNIVYTVNIVHMIRELQVHSFRITTQ